MGKKRVLVAYGVDVDAVANWYNGSNKVKERMIQSDFSRINTCDGSPQNPTNVSRGVYGATVGIDRLLKLLDKCNIVRSASHDFDEGL